MRGPEPPGERAPQQRDPRLAVNDREWLARGPVLVVNGRWVPPLGFQTPDNHGPWVGLCDGLPACAMVGPEDAGEAGAARDRRLVRRDAGRARGTRARWRVDSAAPGTWWRRTEPISSATSWLSTRNGLSTTIPANLALVGPPDRLRIDETARVDPYTVFDTTNGPIMVGPRAWIQPFTRVEGPCSIGAETQLFRGNIRECVSIGPNCRIGGEVEASIVHGHSNKYHEGFLGHAYVGEWVNLGAITSNSDLRNDYGEVSVPLQGDPVKTGQTKVGCFIGDHTRTGMGSMLNTGTSIGVMCNVLPAGLLLPKHVPSFMAVMYGRVGPGFSLDQMFATARIVMGRRGKTFSEAEEQLYLQLFEQTRLERERAFYRAHDHRAEYWPVAQAARLEMPARG